MYNIACMNTNISHENKESLKRIIETRAFISSNKEPILDKSNMEFKQSGWIFDFYRILFDADVQELIFNEFLLSLHDKKINISRYQLIGPESSAIPLLSVFAHLIYKRTGNKISATFARPSRQKDGLLRAIEGNLVQDKKLIVIDDIINSGYSIERILKILKELGMKADYIWTILKFRDDEYYSKIESEFNVKLVSVFELNDFKKTLGIENKKHKTLKLLSGNKAPIGNLKWSYKTEGSNLAYVVPKSDILVDESKVYFANDSGLVHAIDKISGTATWTYRILGLKSKGKGILSGISADKNKIYFGAYDGNIYALDKKTGKTSWVNFDADWVGSSPVLDISSKTLFIGLEFGVLHKKGAVCALNTITGEILWKSYTPEYIHSTPLYIKSHSEIIIGSNDGILRAFNSRNGELLREFDTNLFLDKDSDKLNFAFDRRYENSDIKESIAYNPTKDYLSFGNINGDFFILDRRTFRLIKHLKSRFGIFSTPAFDEDTVYFTSLDKHIYAIDLDSLELKWSFSDNTRIFSSPTIIKNNIVFGTNAGRIHVIDKKSGERVQSIAITERITNKVIYDEETNTLFVRDYANTLHAFEYKD